MKAPADGYTLMLANTGVMVINPALYGKLPYSTLRDFTPIARTAMQPLALLVNPQCRSLRSGLRRLREGAARPGQLRLAGNGGISHLVPEMFKNATGLFMVHIPYRGSAPAFTDLMGGRCSSWPSPFRRRRRTTSRARSRRSRSPAANATRAARHPHRDGKRHQDFEVVGFYGFLAPANLPKDVTAKLSDAFSRCSRTPTSATA
jgi:tripartite-type tricarboxylate transporter receptor subunit TctC